MNSMMMAPNIVLLFWSNYLRTILIRNHKHSTQLVQGQAMPEAHDLFRAEQSYSIMPELWKDDFKLQAQNKQHISMPVVIRVCFWELLKGSVFAVRCWDSSNTHINTQIVKVMSAVHPG